MSDYFDQFEQSMGTALNHGAHIPWYSRPWRIRHGRALAVVFGALMIGTPAGAVSSCFGACPPAKPALAQSVPSGAATQLLSLSAADAHSGLTWDGRRVVTRR